MSPARLIGEVQPLGGRRKSVAADFARSRASITAPRDHPAALTDVLLFLDRYALMSLD
jgi:hypothetical protein